ncbi:hypothetical protein [Desulfitobacterium hafniense]|nr:hypothetical protein [Desulfitobacterium hafniense]
MPQAASARLTEWLGEGPITPAQAGKQTKLRTYNALPTQSREAAQGFCFTDVSEFKRAETKLREKPAAESGWKQDVSNRPLSRSDLAGHPTERRA